MSAPNWMLDRYSTPLPACPSCGSQMSRGTRYEAVRTIVVLICWECGEESPPLYRRSHFSRNRDWTHKAHGFYRTAVAS